MGIGAIEATEVAALARPHARYEERHVGGLRHIRVRDGCKVSFCLVCGRTCDG
jgi:hypothetical protein